jgi:ELWxxDGT repeat protein
MKKNYIYLLLTTLISFTAFGQIEQVFDINNGASGSLPANIFVSNGLLYFAADDSAGTNTPGGADLGKELWVSDGTAAGTSFVIDLRTGSDSSSPFSFFEYNGTLYFNANNGSQAVLYSSDGTSGGTVDVGIGTSPLNPQEFGGVMYFINTSGGAGNNNKLNTFNGTTISEVTDTGAGEETIFSAMIPFDGKIFCYMNYSTDDATIGTELYAYNIATTSFELIKDITGDDGNSSISNFTILGTDLYFEALSGLWKTDGTEAGTIAVAAAETSGIGGVNSLFAWDGKLFFEGDDGSNDQLWAYDPALDTVTNISMITGSTATGGNNHDPSDFVPLGDFLYYAGEISDDSSQYLFRTDGVTSVRVDSNIIDIDDMVALNGVLYFEGDDGVTGNELYKLDPTTLSINRVSLNEVSVFPNPSINQITVDGDFTSAVSYTISDINGRTVLSGELTNNTINHNLNSGVYMLQLQIDNSSVTKKIVVN